MRESYFSESKSPSLSYPQPAPTKPLYANWDEVVTACMQWGRWEKRKICQNGWEVEDFIQSHFLRLRLLPLAEITKSRLESTGLNQLRDTHRVREQIRKRVLRLLMRKEFETWVCPATRLQMIGQKGPEWVAQRKLAWTVPLNDEGGELEVEEIVSELGQAVGRRAPLTTMIATMLDNIGKPLALVWLCKVIYLHESKHWTECEPPLFIENDEQEDAEDLAARLALALWELSVRQRSVFLFSVTFYVWQLLEKVGFAWHQALPDESPPELEKLFESVPLSQQQIGARLGCRSDKIREYRYRALKHLKKLLLLS